jgi:hypothetical protein
MTLDPQIASAPFFPRPDLPYGPEDPAAREHRFDTPDGVRLRLRIFELSEDTQRRDAPNLLFFHGNGETARDYDGLADDYRALGATLWAAEYRGYGPCSGEPSVDTFLQDAHHSLDELLRLCADEGRTGPVVAMGRSLGSAPAIELAAHRAPDLAGLIIESGFARVLPLLELMGVPARQLGVTEDDGPRNLDKMKRVDLPLLILHAENDQIIPIADAELLHEAAQDPHRVFFRVPHAGHNDIQPRAGAAYFQHIADLLQRVG